MKCLICNESSGKSLCDDCSNKKGFRTLIRTGQIFMHKKVVKCINFVKNVSIKR